MDALWLLANLSRAHGREVAVTGWQVRAAAG